MGLFQHVLSGVQAKAVMRKSESAAAMLWSNVSGPLSLNKRHPNAHRSVTSHSPIAATIPSPVLYNFRTRVGLRDGASNAERVRVGTGGRGLQIDPEGVSLLGPDHRLLIPR